MIGWCYWECFYGSDTNICYISVFLLLLTVAVVIESWRSL